MTTSFVYPFLSGVSYIGDWTLPR